MAARTWNKAKRESGCLMGVEFQFYKMEKPTEMDGDDGCKTL